eukprot:TRINITY_DN30302_c0_g1_i1.p1 TRINITY_DN30302_c0_g1~~TRINITY_DN30302_c0_g1_i1.p1  ORF type:complete len:974 (+),score=256.18 TRINITY_DN30302_c0_g1_i1:57-2978(+)
MSKSETSRRVDDRVKVALENAVQSKHRSFFLLVGDNGRDQVVNLHAMVSKAMHKSKVNVLWCYKDSLSFGSASKRRRAVEFKKEVERGITSADTNNEFEVFLSQNKIRFCYYKDTQKILGQTYGMCVLQDFEALTPNLLARTMETVEGGGLVVLLIRTMKSLKQLYTITMDVHSRYRTSQHADIVPRFNERFLLSLADCKSFLCVNDKLEVLPFTSSTRSKIKPLQKDIFTEEEKKLKLLQEELKANAIVGPLIQACVTLQQATSVLDMMEAITEKKLTTTATVTAGRGRGKSAALGLAAAGAVTQGYSNIFVTAPTPENVQTLFEFVVRGLKEMGYVEREHYEVVQAEAAELSQAVIRINIFKSHRQTVQYILPNDGAKFAQAELLIVDEAAAIPLPLVKSMMGPYLVFLSSTITGYEGTGRSLSLKLFSDLKKQSKGTGGRSLKEINMTQPIRYGSNDPVEDWMNHVLCLDAEIGAQNPAPVHPDQLELFYVNRDTLFSYHSAAEELLQRIVALYVSSHYKNSPNDIQLLSDAPAHHLFVLLDPKSARNGGVPDVYAVIQVCEEGSIQANKLETDLGKGLRPNGDIIPYTLSQHFQESSFAELSGLRVVRIAVLPDMTRQKYGSKALELLTKYYNGEICSIEEPGKQEEAKDANEADDGSFTIRPRDNLPHLLHRLTDRKPERCHYIGVSYGLSVELYNYWTKGAFAPVYLRQGKNDLTGEHSMIMLRSMNAGDGVAQEWVDKYNIDFGKRFVRLLPLSFRKVPVVTALSVACNPKALKHVKVDGGDCYVKGVKQITESDLMQHFTPYDLQRLSAFTRQLVDKSVILDLVPIIATMYFTGTMYALPDGGAGVNLPIPQAAVLMAIGLQGLTFDDIIAQTEFSSTRINQLVSFFEKALNRVQVHFDALRSTEIPAATTGESDGLVPTNSGKIQSVISLPKKRAVEGEAKESSPKKVAAVAAGGKKKKRKVAK